MLGHAQLALDALALGDLARQAGVQGAQVVGGRVGVHVEDGRQTEAQEEVLGRAFGLGTWSEGGQTGEVVLGEEQRVEPVYAALVTELVSTTR